ncbi:MAG: MerR family transcriptional regulator [Acidimicrobiia bacterium]|nr:MAG: MerR family transcriptional regulator [Acidimicrobiia bacterium]
MRVYRGGMNTYTVGDIASMAGITVRTLHHYDEIGLLTPSHRTESGYRMYDDEAIERLQAILSYRSLGLGLDEIAAAIDDADEAIKVLRDARQRVLERIKHLEVIAMTLTRTITDHARGDTMSTEDKLSAFGDFDPAEHEQEAEDRWGATDMYKESTRRTSSYQPQDWEKIKSEANTIYQDLVALMNAGIPAESDEAAALVEEHRAHISRWYYECSPRNHAALGRMYVANPRFAVNIDDAGEGLTEYLSAAIAAAYTTSDDESA